MQSAPKTYLARIDAHIVKHAIGQQQTSTQRQATWQLRQLVERLVCNDKPGCATWEGCRNSHSVLCPHLQQRQRPRTAAQPRVATTSASVDCAQQQQTFRELDTPAVAANGQWGSPGRQASRCASSSRGGRQCPHHSTPPQCAARAQTLAPHRRVLCRPAAVK